MEEENATSEVPESTTEESSDISLVDLQSSIDALTSELQTANASNEDISVKLDDILTTQQGILANSELILQLSEKRLELEQASASATELEASVSDESYSEYEQDVLNQLSGLNTCFIGLFLVIGFVLVYKFFKIFF